MLEQERIVGDYIRSGNRVTANQRRQIVFLIKQLMRVEPIIKVETVYDAVCIADRYLIKVI